MERAKISDSEFDNNDEIKLPYPYSLLIEQDKLY